MARRVNIRFLTILTAATALLVAVVLIGPRFLRPHDASKVLADARQAVEKKDYLLARDLYGRAVAIEPNNPQICLEFGDVYSQTVRSERNDMGKDEEYWGRALVADPKFKAAAERLLNRYIEYTQLSPGVLPRWERLGQWARSIESIDPQDARGPAYQAIAVVGSWLNGSSVPVEDVEKAVVKLTEMAPKHPEISDIAWWAAQTRLQQMRDARVKGNKTAADELQAKALGIFDAALKASPANAGLLYRQAQVLFMMGDADGDGRPDAAVEEKANSALAQAFAAAKPGQTEQANSEYREICTAYARQCMGKGETEKAIKIIKDLLEKQPHSTSVRLQAADMLRRLPHGTHPEAAKEALEIIEAPTSDDPELSGVRALTTEYYEFKRLAAVVQVRIDTFYDAADESQRSAIRAQIEQDYRAAATHSREDDPELMKLHAYVLLLDGKKASTLEAVRLMQSVLEKLAQRRVTDLDVTMRLANAYLLPDVNQPGLARDLLMKVVNARPTNTALRKRLAEVLLFDHDFEQARDQVRELEKQAKDDPEVMRLRIRTMVALGQQDQLGPMVEALPQSTPQQIVYKAGAYQLIKKTPQAVALLAPLSEKELANPQERDFPVSRVLVTIYAGARQNEEALALIGKVLAKVPQEPRWLLTKAMLEGHSSPQEAINLIERSSSDRVDAAIRSGQLFNNGGETDKALSLLLEADKQFHDSRLDEAIFTQSLFMRRFDVAVAYAKRLEKANYDEAGGLSYRTRLLLAGGLKQDGSALQSAMELTRRRPDYDVSWLLMGKAQQAAGQFEPALLSYNKALERQPNNAEALRGLIECNLQLNRVGAALQTVARGMRLPNQQESFADLGYNITELYDNPAKVTPVREKYVKEHPDRPGGYLALGDNYWRCVTHVDWRRDRVAVDELLKKAQAVFRQGIEKWPDSEMFYNRLTQLDLTWAFYVNTAEEQKALIEEARSTLGKLAEREAWKNRPEPELMLAIFFERVGLMDDAQNCYTRAVEKSKGALVIRSQLADFYRRQRRIPQEIVVLKQMLEQIGTPEAGSVQETSRWDVMTHLVQAYVVSAQTGEAEKLVSAALSAAPNDPRALTLMSYIKLTLRDTEAARKYIEKALAASPDDPIALYQRAAMEMSGGDLAGAEKDLIHARQAAPNRADIRIALADVFEHKGRVNDAAGELETALTISPELVEPRIRLLNMYAADARWVPFKRLLDAAKNNSVLSGNPVWWVIEARADMQQSPPDVDAAMNAIETALHIDPNDEQAQRLRLTIVQATGNNDLVLKLTEPDDKHPLTRSWWALSARALALKAKGDAAKAQEAIDGAVMAVDAIKSQEAAQSVSPVLVQVLGLDAAVGRLQARVAPYWALEVARMCATGGGAARASKAADDLMATTANLPQHLQMQSLLLCGQIYATVSGQFPEARARSEQAYVRFLEVSGRAHGAALDEIHALNNLAALLCEGGKDANPVKAVTYSKGAYDRAVALGLDNSSVADTHGWCLVLAGQLDDGIEVLQRAISSTRPVPDAYYHLGEAFILKASTPGALKDASLAKSHRDAAKNYLDQADAVCKDNQSRGLRVDPSLAGKIAAAREKLKQLENGSAAANAGR